MLTRGPACLGQLGLVPLGPAGILELLEVQVAGAEARDARHAPAYALRGRGAQATWRAFEVWTHVASLKRL